MKDSLKNKVKIGDRLIVRKDKRAFVGYGNNYESVKVLDVITEGIGELPLFTIEIDDFHSPHTLSHKFFTAIKLSCPPPSR